MVDYDADDSSPRIIHPEAPMPIELMNGLDGAEESNATAAATDSNVLPNEHRPDTNEFNGIGMAAEIMSKNKRRRMKKKQLNKDPNGELNEHDEDKENGGTYALNN